MKQLCLLVAVLGIIFAGCNASPNPQRAATPPNAVKPPGDSASSVPLSVKTWKETEALIAGHKGKVVVVDLWSTWCQPCIDEFPGLVKLHEKHSGNVVCISANLNYSGAKGETPEDTRVEVLKFLNDQKANFQNVLCADPDTDVYQTLSLAAVPAVLVYDKSGELRKRFDNETNEYGEAGFKYDLHIAPFVEMLVSDGTK
jgi:thiol-disulfide isomerase/thioredoxin